MKNKENKGHKDFQDSMNAPVQINIDGIHKEKYKVLICTPAYGGMFHDGYYRSCLLTMDILKRNNIPFQFASITNESLVTRARNTLVSIFLNSEFTHLMFIDADITYHPDYIVKMLYDTLKDDVEIVTGAYPKKGINWTSIIKAVQDGATDPKTIEGYNQNYVVNFAHKDTKIIDGLIELTDAGTGFMMIKKSVFDKLIKKYGKQCAYENDIRDWPEGQNRNFYAFFDTCIEGEGLLKKMPGHRRYLSEDYFFCRLCQSIGIKIWFDPRINLEHAGHYNFKGSSQKLISFDSKEKEDGKNKI